MRGLLAIILAGAAELFRRRSWRRLRQSDRLGKLASRIDAKAKSLTPPGDRP